MRECSICCAIINNANDIVFLACSQYLCRDCFQESKQDEKCYFCKQPGFKKNHVVYSNYAKFACQILMEPKQICDECNEVMTWNDCASHQCPENIVSCICNLKLKRKDFYIHEKFHCSQKIIECFLCKQKHKMIEDCFNTKVTCFHCERKIPKHLFEHHIETKHIRCSNINCSFIGANIDKHLQDCKYYAVICHFCMQSVSFCQLENHQIFFCEMSKYCEQIMTYHDFITEHTIVTKCSYCDFKDESTCKIVFHEKSCDYKPVICFQCNEKISKFDIQHHLKETCLKRLLICCCNKLIAADEILIHKNIDCEEFFDICSAPQCRFQTKRKDLLLQEHKCPQKLSNQPTFSLGEIIDYQLSSDKWISARIIDKTMDGKYIYSERKILETETLSSASKNEIETYSHPYLSVKIFYQTKVLYAIENLIWHKIIISEVYIDYFEFYHALNPNKKISINKRMFNHLPNPLQRHGYFSTSDFEIGHVFVYETSCFIVIAQDMHGLLLEEFGRMDKKKFLQFSYSECFKKLVPLCF